MEEVYSCPISLDTQVDLLFTSGSLGMAIVIALTGLMTMNLSIYPNSDPPGPYWNFVVVRTQASWTLRNQETLHNEQ